jgi:membrane protein implicated in regulation of membrane protease activity
MSFTLSSFFFLCMIAGLIYALLSAIFSGIFSGHGDGATVGDNVDATGEHSSIGGELQFSPLSPAVLAVFITIFGAVGLVCIRAAHLSALPAVSIATLSALGSAIGTYYIFRTLYRSTQGSSEATMSELVGLEAEVLTPLEGTKTGEIAYVQKGTRYTSMARSKDGSRIDSHASVKIVKVVGNLCVVELD